MDFEGQVVFLEEVAPDQIEVEVETSETYLFNPLTDHNYNLTEPKEATNPRIPNNVKIRELKALYYCKKCGYTTLKKDAMDAHTRTHNKPKSNPPVQRYIPCPSCNTKKQETYEKCTHCSFFTKKKASLRIHMRIHMNKKPYKCTVCDERTENLKQLITHYDVRHKGFEKLKKIKR